MEAQNINNQDLAPDTSESAVRIADLHVIETRIVRLLETAGRTVAILSDDSDLGSEFGDKRQTFEHYVAQYMELLNDIQAGLRRQFHYLASSGIATTNLPYRRSVYGEEKEFSSWAQVVTVLRKEMQTLLQELDVNVVDTDRPSH
ncbi:hypothetical protein K493DRAFT_405250 [Basidiobolus meristosporus CBS 931.73]|uniref:Mediator of RNA polymerase II transcription subunit 11 n=1 Tax=Basidiobolus meristosporus CBS 931.73 TaxID=1314790 RepID=A0A1Y1YWU9_9FUNG|nr:hypothetical protein K493DRAFT_405250 [Basidiobolus meristosporus CBS 931.73]|eukprot:ORY02501.1 hypothetical protein K493DRAFT_405250 [Basidiobolus meristosporus CBS 931.73]